VEFIPRELCVEQIPRDMTLAVPGLSLIGARMKSNIAARNPLQDNHFEKRSGPRSPEVARRPQTVWKATHPDVSRGLAACGGREFFTPIL